MLRLVLRIPGFHNRLSLMQKQFIIDYSSFTFFLLNSEDQSSKAMCLNRCIELFQPPAYSVSKLCTAPTKFKTELDLYQTQLGNLLTTP